MDIFLAQIPFLIGHLHTVNSLFKKKSELKNLIHIEAIVQEINREKF